MLYYDRIDISEEIEPTKSNRSKECMIFHYLVFNSGLKFQGFACNGCRDFIMLGVYLNDIAVITIKNIYYRCIIHKIGRSEAINLLKNYVLKNGGYIIFCFHDYI